MALCNDCLAALGLCNASRGLLFDHAEMVFPTLPPCCDTHKTQEPRAEQHLPTRVHECNFNQSLTRRPTVSSFHLINMFAAQQDGRTAYEAMTKQKRIHLVVDTLAEGTGEAQPRQV